MHKILLIIFLFPLILFGQSRLESNADEQFQLLAFDQAISNYKLCLKKDPDNHNCIFKIAHCYQKLNNLETAEQWYNKGFTITDSVKPEYKYNYAHCLYANGKHNEAKKWFLNYNNSLEKSDEQALRFLRSIKSYSEYFIDTSFVRVKNLAVNSNKSDFPSSILENKIAFVSNRRNNDEEVNRSFYSIYFAEKNINTGKFTSTSKLKKLINDKYHSGSIVFYNNNANAIVSQTAYQSKNKASTGSYSLQLYEGGFDENQSRLTYLNRIQLLNATNSHPTVNEDGTILIFSSNFNSETKGMDLFISIKIDGVWSTPNSLGDKINTKGNEIFPFLFNNSILYFASDGHGGLGGLDIFKINLNKPALGVENLSYPVNSSYDDFSVILESNGIDGYFASNRPGGIGDDDIYSFETVKIRFKGLVKDKESEQPIANVKILAYASGVMYKTTYTDSLGNFEVIVPPKEDVEFEMFSENYIKNRISKINVHQKKALFYLQLQPEIKKEILNDEILVVELQKQENELIVQNEQLIVIPHLPNDSVCVFLEVINPAENKVVDAYLVQGLWVDEKAWDTFTIEIIR